MCNLQRRHGIVLAALTVATLAAALVSLSPGSVRVPLSQVLMSLSGNGDEEFGMIVISSDCHGSSRLFWWAPRWPLRERCCKG